MQGGQNPILAAHGLNMTPAQLQQQQAQQMMQLLNINAARPPTSGMASQRGSRPPSARAPSARSRQAGQVTDASQLVTQGFPVMNAQAVN